MSYQLFEDDCIKTTFDETLSKIEPSIVSEGFFQCILDEFKDLQYTIRIFFSNVSDHPSKDTVRFKIYNEDIPDESFEVYFIFDVDNVRASIRHTKVANEFLLRQVLYSKELNKVFFVPDWSYETVLTFEDCMEVVHDLALDTISDTISRNEKMIEKAGEEIKEYSNRKKLLKDFMGKE